ncbi:hypothetical protein BDZ91DRAFT_741223 [Kalaharituber pfeilii]|nr:hypothetical protein BDZ91DRAFT_741223 [Kalaharituber pfeilii]
MSKSSLMNPLADIEARIATLEYVEVKQKNREIDGQIIPQVGLFARKDLQRPIPKSIVILEEQPLVYYHEPLEDDDDGDIDHFQLTLHNLTPEKRTTFNRLYNSPELQRVGSIDDADLGRWWTNRFVFEVHSSGSDGLNSGNISEEKSLPKTNVEAIYQHSSAIDHSCFNSNAKAILKPRSPEMTIQIISNREIEPGEEILIHYDWREYHDMNTGRRLKNGETVHSDLWINRGFHCENCVFGMAGRKPRSKPVPDLRRHVLQAASPMAAFRRRNSSSSGLELEVTSCLGN